MLPFTLNEMQAECKELLGMGPAEKEEALGEVDDGCEEAPRKPRAFGVAAHGGIRVDQLRDHGHRHIEALRHV